MTHERTANELMTSLKMVIRQLPYKSQKTEGDEYLLGFKIEKSKTADVQEPAFI